MKKLPKDITDQALLDALKSQDENLPAVLEYFNDVVPFISHFNIGVGTELVTNKLIYWLYTKWSKEPLSKSGFFQEFSKYIPAHNSNYKINVSSLTLSEAAYKMIQKKVRDPLKTKKGKFDFDQFLERYSIQKGNKWVPSYLIYYYYRHWADSLKKKPLSLESFTQFCKLYFEHKKPAPKQVYFKLNNQFERKYLDKELRDAIREDWEKSTSRKKNEPKIKEEVSKFRPQIKFKE